MRQFERKELTQIFPFSDGWKTVSTTCPAFAASVHLFRRDLWVGSEHATVVVVYEPVVSSERVAMIRSRYMNGNARDKLVLMVPKGADVASVPNDIGIISMSSFGYDTGKLVWLTKKKNAKKYPGTAPAGQITANKAASGEPPVPSAS